MAWLLVAARPDRCFARGRATRNLSTNTHSSRIRNPNFKSMLKPELQHPCGRMACRRGIIRVSDTRWLVSAGCFSSVPHALSIRRQPHTFAPRFFASVEDWRPRDMRLPNWVSRRARKRGRRGCLEVRRRAGPLVHSRVSAWRAAAPGHVRSQPLRRRPRSEDRFGPSPRMFRASRSARAFSAAEPDGR